MEKLHLIASFRQPLGLQEHQRAQGFAQCQL